MVFKTTRRDRPMWLRVLVHPMLYISLLVHGLVFAIPGSPEEEIPENIEEEEEIQITMLPAVVEPEPEIPVEELPAEPPPAAETLPQAAVPPPQPPPQPAPQQQQAPPPEEPEPEPEEELPELPSAPAFDPTPYRSLFSDQVASLEQSVDFGDRVLEPRLWKEPEQFFVNDANGEPQLRPGIIQIPQWLNDVRPENIRPERSGEAQAGERITDQIIYLGSLFDPSITVRRAGDYGGGPLFEVVSPEGEPVMYINAVQAKSGPSTFLIMWSFNPNSPPPAAAPVEGATPPT
ncbi:MAG: hypothetical protein VKK04_12030 [Synechococcales bacterium]|nr:hypothetical protein [Synechococcales bacterium]